MGVVSDLNVHKSMFLDAPTDKKSTLKSDLPIIISGAAAGRSSEYSSKIDPLSIQDFQWQPYYFMASPYSALKMGSKKPRERIGT